MSQYRIGGFGLLPPVVKNLLIVNVIFFLATIGLQRSGTDLYELFGLHYFASGNFKVYQFVTYMFMHGSFWHLFFNMFALWMFGNLLENVMSSKRFLTYYMVTGVGAAVIQMLVYYLRIQAVEAQLDPEQVALVYQNGLEALNTGMNFIDPTMANLNILINMPTVGASGAVFGILLAFGMLFPNQMIYVYFAIPVKAKYFVIIYGLLELYMGVSNRSGDNVAHFAHLGGMLFGIVMLLYWRKKYKRR
jgi:membrane associated rhomboid family serine protease